jgi:hypothetical protein
MDTKTIVTPADLFVLLDREFRRRRPRECATCFVQLPYRVDTPNGDGPNWEIVPPADCSKGCAIVIEEIVEDFQARYELRANGERT